jgi:asparaginyl-tRNA synthetase
MSAPGTERRTSITALLSQAAENAPVEVTGWVKTSRFSKNVSFVHLFDGSSASTIQVILSKEQAEAWRPRLGMGTAVRIRGTWKASPGGKQAWEVTADSIEVVGDSNPTDYPIQPKRMTMEYLRTIAHLRPRTNTFQSVFRVRNAVSWHIHRFFQERGFQWVHTPILTASDAEGAGEMFEVRAGKDHFFGRPTFLTVSGQLAVENFAQAFTDVYTFGPTFRAENSNTRRHASEFWMIEPEIAFADLDDVIALAEAFIKEVSLATIEQLPGDFAFFDRFIHKGVLSQITEALDKPFARVTWHEAQEILAKSGKSFDQPIGPGTSLQTEHERFLAEEHFKSPVFVTDYPAEQKSFYMRLNDDGETVAATDLLVPRIGEIIGGSQREERLDVLDARIRAHGLDAEAYWWYRDLRRFGTTPHGGFGLGLERLILWLTGMQNIRDVLPFPRTPGHAEF